MSKIELGPITEELNALIESGNIITIEETVNKYFEKSKDKDDKYPDIFMDLFRALANEPIENEDALILLLMVTCKAEHVQKMQLLKTLICDTVNKSSSKSLMKKERFIEIFLTLFTLCSVRII